MNPWQVLGIAPTSDLRTIQRAYADHLRRHRPDEDAEGYQRLRAAYDAVVGGIRSDIDQGELEDAPESTRDTAREIEGDVVSGGAFDAAMRYADRVAQALNGPVPLAESEEWRALFDDDVLFDLQVRSWLSLRVFGLIAERRRRSSSADMNFELFQLVQAFCQTFGWLDDELELAQAFTSDDIDSVMGFAVGIRGVSSAPTTSGRTRWRVWPITVIVGFVIFAVHTVTTLYQGFGQDSKQNSMATARVALRNGQFEQAVRIFEAIHRNEPSNRDATLLLARSLGSMGDYNRADTVLQDAIVARPNDPGAFHLRAQLAVEQGRFADAKGDFDRALERGANNPFLANDFAWLLATCSNDDIRDGIRATEIARLAVGATRPPPATHVDTLAAALAEMGHYDEAVLEQRRAIELLTKNDAELRDGMQARLDLYLSGKPYRARER